MSCRSHRSLFLAPLFLLLASTLACSDAETPDAQFDGGVREEQPFDAGPGFGGRDEPCSNGRCESPSLVCVSEAQPGGGSQNTCRLGCDLDDETDPCGLRSTCVRLLDPGAGACLPAGGLDEGCPCDEGYSCASLPTGNGDERVNICKRTCVVDGSAGDPDPNAIETCPGQEECRRLQGSDNLGVCLDD